jgi:hypothetical protein
MNIGLEIQVRSADVDRKLQAFFAQISDRTEMNQAIGERARELTRNHLVAIAESRHATAERLGATPSGHWGQAAEKTTFEADGIGATVSVHQRGISRVAHDVEIKPGEGKKYLTIPAIAEAYNQRAYRVPGLHLIFGRKAGEAARPIALGTGAASEIKYGRIRKDGSRKITHTASQLGTIWYWLVKSVHQKQDRTLLPSDEEYRLSALAGVRDFLSK